MTRSQRSLWALIAVTLVIVVTSGCLETSAKNRVEHFRSTQKETMTTHGKIKMESVEDKDGKIYYQTTDGKRWRVDMTVGTDKTYHCGTPEEIP